MQTLMEKAKAIKLVALDFDGTLTDGFVYTDQSGVESVRCSRKDSLGIEMLKKDGIEVVVISKEKNPVVYARCKKLQIDCWSGVETGEDKSAVLIAHTLRSGFSSDSVLAMGDDINDLPMLVHASIAVTVADGHPQVRDYCSTMFNFVTKACGGEHAVREMCEWLLYHRQIQISV